MEILQLPKVLDKNYEILYFPENSLGALILSLEYNIRLFLQPFFNIPLSREFPHYCRGNLKELISEKCPGEYTHSSKKGNTHYYSKGFTCDLGQIHASGFYCNGYDSPQDGMKVKLDMSVSQFLEIISPLIFVGWADIIRGSDYNFWFKGEKKD